MHRMLLTGGPTLLREAYPRRDSVGAPGRGRNGRGTMKGDAQAAGEAQAAGVFSTYSREA
jgi:hypothetical protein